MKLFRRVIGWPERRRREREFARSLLSAPYVYAYGGLGWRGAAEMMTYIYEVGDKYGVSKDCISKHIDCVVRQHFQKVAS